MDKDASALAAQVALNRTFNRLNDVLEEEGVRLVAGYGIPVLVLGNTEELRWIEGVRTRAYAQDKPPLDWDDFLARQCDTDKAKGHDYNFSFMSALVKWGPTIWEWESTKKLNRIRTWITKGELRVKGDGIVNAVGDLFNYTVMYHAWIEATALHKDPLKADNPANFYRVASLYKPADWIRHLEDDDLIGAAEHQLKQVIYTFMAGEGAAYR
ncbi:MULTISPECIES: hypothetical protein [Pelosinus]|nr:MULTISPECIES: hypothetical protein [Pelosinus]